MPGPDQLIRTAVGLPLGVARRIAGIAGGLLPGRDGEPAEADAPDVETAVDEALARDREPVEEAALAVDDPLGGHVEPEVELVAESADPEIAEPPGPEIHVDDSLR